MDKEGDDRYRPVVAQDNDRAVLEMSSLPRTTSASSTDSMYFLCNSSLFFLFYFMYARSRDNNCSALFIFAQYY